MATTPGGGRAEPPKEPVDLDYDTVKMVWEQLRAERTNQYSRNASISIVTTSLLGFEGVLVFRIGELNVQAGCKGLSIAAMAISILLLLLCLLDMPFSKYGWPAVQKWAVDTERAMAAWKPSALRKEVEPLGRDQAVQRLLQEEVEMFALNGIFMLKRRRFRLHLAVFFFFLSFLILSISVFL
ncbi:hypothetical protein EDD98_3644 [Streptomyces sp. PanSC19]|uniref:hypothetical protein n=1 Tax=Streptomyces sp. PanSC19 TaxID=1520455 RepID=UPI000FA69415|nr:hypothetical protein [Streptomyces sp. PanSC19]ROQ34597.1 hypothetical protein EDD98_3644 [Streptomyces sp. PanSC19]